MYKYIFTGIMFSIFSLYIICSYSCIQKSACAQPYIHAGFYRLVSNYGSTGGAKGTGQPYVIALTTPLAFLFPKAAVQIVSQRMRASLCP